MSRPAPTTRDTNPLDESGARPIPSRPSARADDVDALLEELGDSVPALAPPKLPDRTEMVPAWFLPVLAGVAFSIGVIGTTTALELYRDAQPTSRALAAAPEATPPESVVVELEPFEFVVDVPSSEVRPDRDEALVPARAEAPEPLMSSEAPPVYAESSLPLSASTDHEVSTLISELATRAPGTGASASLASPLSR